MVMCENHAVAAAQPGNPPWPRWGHTYAPTAPPSHNTHTHTLSHMHACTHAPHPVFPQVADFLQLMAQARFHILSKAEWDLAKADQFMFSLPVEVRTGAGVCVWGGAVGSVGP